MTIGDSRPTPADQYLLNPGFIYVPDQPVHISTVLGSGVSVCIYDRKNSCGGMTHFRYAFTRDPASATALYGNVATATLVSMIQASGVTVRHLAAQIIGGGYNPDISDTDMGRKNIQVARRILARYGIVVVSEDVGGRQGRKVVFDTASNEILIYKVDRLRVGDWYPYESDR